MSVLELVLSRCPDAKRKGNNWWTRSPLRQEKTPSVKITEFPDGSVGVYDFGDGRGKDATPDILTAWGVTMADLMAPKSDNGSGHRPTRPVARQAKRDWLTVVARLQKQLTNDLLNQLGNVTGLPPLAWKDAIPALGYALPADLRELKPRFEGEYPAGAFSIPECDGDRKIIGISLRALDGRKSTAKGGHRGLVIASNFDEQRGVALAVEGASDLVTLYALHLPGVGRPSNSIGATYLAQLYRDRPDDLLIVGENDRQDGGKWPGKEGAKNTALSVATQLERPAGWAMVPPGAKDTREWFKGRIAAGLDPNDPEAMRKAGVELLAAIQASTVVETPLAPRDDSFPCTDVHNRIRLIQHFGDDFRWVPGIGWLAWDGTRWTADDRQSLFAKGQRLGDIILDESTRAAKAGNQKLAEALFGWAKPSRKAATITAAIRCAEPFLALRVEELDADPWLFNCPNGTLNLRTDSFGFREHHRDDYITMMAGAMYSANAECPLFQNFLAQTFNDDPGLIGYVQKLIGMFLTGDISCQQFFVAYGTGANGKSTLLDLLLGLLGDYGARAPDSLFIDDGHGGQHPTELAMLRGKRLVVGSESEHGAKLRLQRIKRLVGDDSITARKMKQDFFTFQQSAKYLFQTNSRPQIGENSEAAWRRIRLIPFIHTVPPEKRNEKLLDALRAELSGILNFAVAGCLNWQKEGLAPPPAVVAATETYRHSEDRLADFIEAECVVGDRQRATAASLYKAYVSWCEANGEKPVSQTAFGRILDEKGMVAEKITSGPDKDRKCRQGIGLRGLYGS